MKHYILLVLFFIGTIACNKKVSDDLQTEIFIQSDPEQEKKITDQINAQKAEWDAEILDPNDFPPPVITTIEELEDRLEFHDNLILAHFNSGSTKPFFALDEQLIQHLVDHINVTEQRTYEIIGHTNSSGNTDENMTLSKLRAAAVYNILMADYKLTFNLVGSNGEGETNPINDNSTPEMRRANSRVELRKWK